MGKTKKNLVNTENEVSIQRACKVGHLAAYLQQDPALACFHGGTVLIVLQSLLNRTFIQIFFIFCDRMIDCRAFFVENLM